MASKALVPVSGCPACGALEKDLVHLTWTEDPLLRGGGYGAARRHRIRVCWCGWEHVFDVSEVCPLRRDRVLVNA